jgi:malate dehydrogenase (quinone)
MNQKSSCNFYGGWYWCEFWRLTRSMFNHLNELEGVSIHFNHEVRTLKQRKDKTWRIKYWFGYRPKKKSYTKFVFIGAGGGSLPLLKKMFQKERFWRFPRKWTMAQMYQSGRYCKAPIKVYGKASGSTAYVGSTHRFKNDQWRNSCYLALCWFSTRFLKMDPIQTCLYP